MNDVKLLEDQDIRTEYSPDANDGKCQYPNCTEDATDIAQDRDRQVVEFYCAKHADSVVDHGRPEYRVSCPNCGCGFGVN